MNDRWYKFMELFGIKKLTFVLVFPGEKKPKKKTAVNAT
jgi:hypothetical protein